MELLTSLSKCFVYFGRKSSIFIYVNDNKTKERIIEQKSKNLYLVDKEVEIYALLALIYLREKKVKLRLKMIHSHCGVFFFSGKMCSNSLLIQENKNIELLRRKSSLFW